MELNERIANALGEARRISDEGIITSDKLSAKAREILTNAGFLERIVRGWYMLVSPESSGSSTAWFSMYWPFVRQYMTERFGEKGYCLSPQSSLDIYTGETTIPAQMIILTRKNSNTTVQLPHGVSILLYQDDKAFPETLNNVNGISLMPLPFAIVKAPPSYYQNKSQNIEIALSMLESVSDISRILIDTGSIAAAERVSGAYLETGNSLASQTVINDMKLAGYSVKPVNPFKEFIPSIGTGGFRSPYAPRIITMWNNFRGDVIQVFPEPLAKGGGVDAETILNRIRGMVNEDAYHSLSIEGYRVSEDLIARIRSGEWNPEVDRYDNNQRNALAAKGYSLAYDAVLKSVQTALTGGNPGIIFKEGLSDWYRELFYPLVQAGILKGSDLVGYRRSPVYIKDAMHIPPPYESVVDAMETLFDLIQEEENGAVRAVLGHYFFVYIHPYMDGNGRLARFLMNLMLVSAGYPWTIIHVTDRIKYMKSLDFVATDKDIRPFTEFIVRQMQGS